MAILDRQAQAEHARRLQAEGQTLLGIRAFCPIGAVMLGVMAWELLEQSFQAVSDWQQNERNAALAHLLNVGKGLLTVGATVAVVAAARRAWSVVDPLVPAQLPVARKNCGTPTWNPTVVAPAAYRSAGRAGVYRLAERCWISMDGHWYEVAWRKNDEQWRLLPYQGYAPCSHNGAGAWRLWCEQPAEWATRASCSAAWASPTATSMTCRSTRRWPSRLDDQHLRAWHVYGRAPEAALADTVQRLLFAGRIHTLVGQLREGAATADQQLLARVLSLPGGRAARARAGRSGLGRAPGAAASHVRAQHRPANPLPVATGLRQHRLAAREVMRNAGEDDLQHLQETGRVPLFMAEAARLQVADSNRAGL